MPDPNERREQIKITLEYAKLIFSFLGLGALVFAGLQWQGSTRAAEEANRAANLAAYQRIATEWREHLRIFIDKPSLRPYFDSRKPLPNNGEQREAVLAVADIKLDTMDSILTYINVQGRDWNVEGWNVTFVEAFRTSPILCQRLRDRWDSYGYVQRPGMGCNPTPKISN